MRRKSLAVASAAAVGTICGVTLVAGERYEAARAGVEPVSVEQVSLKDPVATPVMSVGSAGSALASAAFGLDALQPETYNGEIVLDIIDASPLAGTEKRRLAAGLEAAEAGRADLQRVLSDVRYALAVE